MMVVHGILLVVFIGGLYEKSIITKIKLFRTPLKQPQTTPS